MTRYARISLWLPLALGCLAADAETYKCVQGGKTTFSDTPCAAGASRVDQHSDGISREQRRQADIINQKNASQLSELEYNAARNRYQRGGGVQVLPGDTEQSPSPKNRGYR